MSLPRHATPAEDKPTGGDDPQQDPDYDEAGWGMESASVSYTQLIPVLIKSNQELDARIADLESQLQEHASENQTLRATLQALETRLDSLESVIE